jgi:hypothetical protein
VVDLHLAVQARLSMMISTAAASKAYLHPLLNLALAFSLKQVLEQVQDLCRLMTITYQSF